jgi:ABC-type sugar transport system permease subunit
VIVATISVIFALRTFDIVWVITQGGPAQDSEGLAVLLWAAALGVFKPRGLTRYGRHRRELESGAVQS